MLLKGRQLRVGADHQEKKRLLERAFEPGGSVIRVQEGNS